MNATVAEPAIRFSIAALARARELLREHGDPAARLRIAVDGGGCSGFRYAFSIDAARNAGDSVFERDGVGLLVDSASLPLLAGSEVDYEEKLSGAHFVLHNPNATTTCGCGSSFAA